MRDAAYAFSFLNAKASLKEIYVRLPASGGYLFVSCLAGTQIFENTVIVLMEGVNFDCLGGHSCFIKEGNIIVRSLVTQGSLFGSRLLRNKSNFLK